MTEDLLWQNCGFRSAAEGLQSDLESEHRGLGRAVGNRFWLARV